MEYWILKVGDVLILISDQ